MTKAVFFDVGSTLIDPCPDIDGVFFEVARERGFDLDRGEVGSYLPAVFGYYDERECQKGGDFWASPEGSVEIYLDMYRYLSHLVGLGSAAEELAWAVHSAYQQPRYWRIIDDVLPCLEELKAQDYRLGVVSNWAPNLPDLLSGLMVGRYFDEVVTSASVGYRKPDPKIFTLMLERMGIGADEAVHVGDRPDADGRGAANAGVKPVIIDRKNAYEGCGYTCVRSLDELTQVLQEG